MKAKVIHFEKARKKIRDNRRHRYNARDAYIHFLYQKKYKINSELSDLYMKYLSELKTWTEFKEALPKLEPELLHYTVVHYFFAWHRCMGQLFEPINKGKLGSTQNWRINKPERNYY
jgi:Zn-finger domain-containing protein